MISALDVGEDVLDRILTTALISAPPRPLLWARREEEAVICIRKDHRGRITALSDGSLACHRPLSRDAQPP